LSSVSNRAGDFVARYGGEEFVYVWPNCELKQASIMAEKARIEVFNMAIPHEYSDAENVVTISLGLASVTPTLNQSRKELLDCADEKLYVAKQSGRNMLVAGDL